jgi:peptidoglycan/LPS O-acetylase OafA/YrhL
MTEAALPSSGGAAIRSERFPTLDLLRLVAISMTLLMHTRSLTARIPGLSSARDGLWLGVDLFMLISGWLLGGQLLREDRADGVRPARFYFKRWMRTLPPYYAMLALLYWVPGTPEFHGPLPWSVIINHMTFVQVYAGRNDYMVSWSLCVEEHFYLLLPAVVLGLRRISSLRIAVVAALALEVLSIAFRVHAFDPQESIPFESHIRCHGLFVGLLFAFAYLRHPRAWRRLTPYLTSLGIAGILGTIVLLVLIPEPPSAWMFVLAPTLGTWTFAMVFLPCVHSASRWSKVSFPGLDYLGGLTYSMYLTHSVLPRVIVDYAGPAGTLKGAIWRLLMTAAAALLLHHIVERPFLGLRARVLALMARRERAPAGAASRNS